MKIKKAILEKEEFGKLILTQKSYWVDWSHQGSDDHSMIIGICTIDKDSENKAYTVDIDLFDKDETFTYPDSEPFSPNGYKQAKKVLDMLESGIKLYPAISAKVIKSDVNGNMVEAELLTVGICLSNADSTIPPLELEN